MANPKDGDDEFFGNFDDDQPSVSNPNCADTDDRNLVEGMAEYESKATDEQFFNMGYLDAFDDAKEIRLQDGFEAGYRSVFDVSTRIGEILGHASASKFHENTSNEQSELTVLQQMSKKILLRLQQVGATAGDRTEDASVVLDELEAALLQQQIKPT
jgi:hypothetical protein